MNIYVKRIYEDAAAGDGYRVLVDRLWPRGIKKEKAGIDKWLKEVAPSTNLREWFNHEAEKWKEFKTRYYAEIKDTPAFEELQAEARRHTTVTLLYGAKDEEYNQATALAGFLKKAIHKQKP
ncbi:MAG TPA: DUF488 family protein [Chitinophagaceae bacterium]|jgi:uncharacterized protein YeaO (DUF488 family)|nr:DUF488 family protein [Chitinophagaceae bacterium]